MILDDIADYLSSGGIGSVGTDIFKGYLPDTPDVVTVVFETEGLGAYHTMNADPGRAVAERPAVRVVCRSEMGGYESARTMARSVFRLLEGLPTRDINGVDYKWGAARRSPYLFGRDKGGRAMLACEFDIVRELSTLTFDPSIFDPEIFDV